MHAQPRQGVSWISSGPSQSSTMEYYEKPAIYRTTHHIHNMKNNNITTPFDTIKAWPDKQLLKYCALLSMSIEDPKTTKEEAESYRETLAMVKAEYLSRPGECLKYPNRRITMQQQQLCSICNIVSKPAHAMSAAVFICRKCEEAKENS